MLDLVDGPCQGNYMCKRAPVFLRAVINAAAGTDVLDQVDDTPAEAETVYVYRREGGAGWVHIKGPKVKGVYALGRYHYLPEVDGQALRDNKVWQAWAASQNGGGI